MDGSQWSSVQSSHSVVSNSLRPHRPQRSGPPCLSPTPRVYPNSCPLSRWCHPTISSSVVPFSSCPQSFPASGSFQMSQFFTSGGQNIGVSASTSILPQWRVLTKCGPQQNLDRVLKSRDITWPTKVHVVKAMVLPVVMYRCESWSIKRAGYQRIDAFNCGAGEDSWECLDSKEIKPVHPKGYQPWIFIGRTDAEAPMLWPPDVKSQLIGKYPDAGKDQRQKERLAEDETAIDSMDVNLSNLKETVEDRGARHAVAHGVRKSHTWLSN